MASSHKRSKEISPCQINGEFEEAAKYSKEKIISFKCGLIIFICGADLEVKQVEVFWLPAKTAEFSVAERLQK